MAGTVIGAQKRLEKMRASQREREQIRLSMGVIEDAPLKGEMLRRRVLQLIQQEPETYTEEQIARLLKVSTGSVRGALDKLEDLQIALFYLCPLTSRLGIYKPEEYKHA